MIAEEGTTEDAVRADRAAKVCLLAPNSVSDLAPALRLAGLAADSRPDFPWYRLVKGWAELRAGHPDAAISWLEPVFASDELRAAILAGYAGSMAHHRLQHPEQAQAVLGRTNERFDAFLREGDLTAGRGERWWFDGAAAMVLRAEAEKLILGKLVSPQPTMASLGAARRAWPAQNENRPSRPPVREPAETALVGKPVPGPFKLDLLEGGDFELPLSPGTNVLLLDFWATWCGPCRQVMPTLAEVAKDYAARGVRYVAVNLREKPEVIRRYLTSAKLDITVALDTDGSAAKAFQVNGIPTMVVVDRNNIVRKIHVGASAEVGAELRAALDELLGKDNPTTTPESPN
jgi:thiol-disulfide isomerase/thioredoxin